MTETKLIFTGGKNIKKTIELFGAPIWCFVWNYGSCWYTPNRPLARAKLCLWYGNLEKYEFDGSHYGKPGKTQIIKNKRGEYQYIPDKRGKHLSDIFDESLVSLHSEEYQKYAKPIDWIRLLIANCTIGNIIDYFGGTGTSLIACEQLDRKCFMMEINPKNCQIIIDRWELFTGNKAKKIN
jgi:DNA modification methylase